MPSTSEIKDLRDPTRIVLAPDWCLTRGLRELRPKRYDAAKAAVGLVRPLIIGKGPRAERVSLFMPGAGGEAERALALLNDLERVTVGADLFPNLIDSLCRDEELRVVAAIGDGGSPNLAAFSALEGSLQSLTPGLERGVVTSLAAQVKSSMAEGSGPVRTAGDRQILEEKPGKAFALAFEDLTLKHRMRAFGQVLQRPASARGIEPMDIVEGFGLGALRIAGDDARLTGPLRAMNLAVTTYRCADPAMELRTVDAIWSAAAAALKAWQAPTLEKMQSIYLSVPSYAVTGCLTRRLNELAPGATQDVRSPDLVFGWAPLLTLIELVARAPAPSLLISAGRFPSIHIVAVY